MITQKRKVQDETKVYLIGAGIASLAAAAFLIRDAGFKGHNIVILEESEKIGGSLDANGTSEAGYVSEAAIGGVFAQWMRPQRTSSGSMSS